MNSDEKIDIAIKRDYLVVKSNQLVQKSRYELSLTEQRAVAYICSMIKPSTKEVPYQLDYVFDIQQYAKVCGLYHLDGGKLYQDTRALLKRLMQKIIHVEMPDGDELLIAWLVRVHLNKRSGQIKIRLSEDMAPFLFDLQERFTAYGLLNILAMKSQYSIRIYELLRSYAFRKEVTLDIEDLKKRLMVDSVKSYTRFPDFRRKVLDPAMEEINEYTDISASYEPITKGRKVIKIKFILRMKPPTERYMSYTKADSEVDS